LLGIFSIKITAVTNKLIAPMKGPTTGIKEIGAAMQAISQINNL
jgi:hypothetical protein